MRTGLPASARTLFPDFLESRDRALLLHNVECTPEGRPSDLLPSRSPTSDLNWLDCHRTR